MSNSESEVSKGINVIIFLLIVNQGMSLIGYAYGVEIDILAVLLSIPIVATVMLLPVGAWILNKIYMYSGRKPLIG